MALIDRARTGHAGGARRRETAGGPKRDRAESHRVESHRNQKSPNRKGPPSKLTADRQKAQILTRRPKPTWKRAGGTRPKAKATAQARRDLDVAYDLPGRPRRRPGSDRRNRSAAHLAGKTWPAPAIVPAEDDLPEMASDEIAEGFGLGRQRDGRHRRGPARALGPGLLPAGEAGHARAALREDWPRSSIYRPGSRGNGSTAARCRRSRNTWRTAGKPGRSSFWGHGPCPGTGLAPDPLGQGPLAQGQSGREERDPGFDHRGDDLPRRIDQVDEQRQIALDKLRHRGAERQSSEARAAGAATDPQAALGHSRPGAKQRGAVGAGGGHHRPAPGESPGQVAPRDIEYSRKINAPKIEMAQRTKGSRRDDQARKNRSR